MKDYLYPALKEAVREYGYFDVNIEKKGDLKIAITAIATEMSEKTGEPLEKTFQLVLSGIKKKNQRYFRVYHSG